ncbi:MAG: hypothetical protein R3E55_08300 [Burkholderiaceae bacterium]
MAELAPRLVALGHQVQVFGSSIGRGSRRQPIGRVCAIDTCPCGPTAPSVPYDLLSFLFSLRRCDAVVVMGVSAGVCMPLMRWLAGARRIVVNVDGLEARRSKWRGLPRAFFASEQAARHPPRPSGHQQPGRADIVASTYGRASTIIPYGNDHVQPIESEQARALVRQRSGWSPGAIS